MCTRKQLVWLPKTQIKVENLVSEKLFEADSHVILFISQQKKLPFSKFLLFKFYSWSKRWRIHKTWKHQVDFLNGNSNSNRIFMKSEIENSSILSLLLSLLLYRPSHFTAISIFLHRFHLQSDFVHTWLNRINPKSFVPRLFIAHLLYCSMISTVRYSLHFSRWYHHHC